MNSSLSRAGATAGLNSSRKCINGRGFDWSWMMRVTSSPDTNIETQSGHERVLRDYKAGIAKFSAIAVAVKEDRGARHGECFTRWKEMEVAWAIIARLGRCGDADGGCICCILREDCSHYGERRYD